jgi:hypothetical protein
LNFPAEDLRSIARILAAGYLRLRYQGRGSLHLILPCRRALMDTRLTTPRKENHVEDTIEHQIAELRLWRAVEHERERLLNVQGVPTAAKTALGRDQQECLGTVGPVADRYVEAVANEILLTKNGEKGRPN